MTFPDPEKPLKDQDPLVLLAITVWAEARGEGPDSKSAVAHVVLNRVRKKKSSIAKEALRPWAFSCYNDPKFGGQDVRKLLRPVETEGLGSWATCWRAASEAQAGQSADPTGGATHYCRRKLWLCAAVAGHPKGHDIVEIYRGRTKKTFVIGSHVFAITPF